eukprot:s1682_g7.t2
MDQRGRELMRLSRLQHHLINILHLLLNQKMSLYVHNGWKYPLPMVLRPIHIGLPSMTILLTTIRDKNEYPRSIDETPRHVADSPANGTTPIEHYVRRVVTYLARVQSVTQSQQGLILRMYVKLDTKEWLKMHARLYNACELTSCFHLPDPVLLTAAVLVKDETDLVARDDVTDEMRTMTMRSINSLRNGDGCMNVLKILYLEKTVRGMAQNKSRGVSGAQSMTEFPVNTYNLKGDLVKHILPLLYPLLLTTAVIAGNPGVGKTPTVTAMAMAIGRFHIERLGLQGVLPGWRRAKSLDNFRQRAPQIQEAIFLDDPSKRKVDVAWRRAKSLDNFRQRAPQIQEAIFLDDPSKRKVDVADLKAFVSFDEDGTVEGRYCDARLLRNQMRAYASNDTGEDPKDTKPGDTTLSTDSFMKLVHPLFGDAHVKDKLAVLKRNEDPDAQRASMGLPPVFPAIGNGLRPDRLGTFSCPSPAKRLRVKTTSIEPLPKTETETNQDINLAADPGMTADEEAARRMHN